MIVAPKPENERERLKSLREFNLLDSIPERDYDNITKIASDICNVPISLISIIDEDRQWFKSRVGMDDSETKRDYAFCAHAILKPDDIMMVNDTAKDERFFDNPLVTGSPKVAFYAGVPLVNEDGHPLGTLCVIDHKPNELTKEQQNTLRALAGQIVAYFELRKKNIELIQQTNELETLNGELERFAYVAAHDLKSPCNTLTMISTVLRDTYSKQLDGDGMIMLDMLTQASASMTGLVDGILQHTRTVNTTDTTQQEFKFSEVIDELRKLLNLPPGFAISSNNGDMTLYTSRSAITQILLNLGTNAIKYNDKEKGLLEFSVKDGDVYAFSVKDNGPGIPLSEQGRIFDLFTTLGRPDRDDKMGHGIGLSTVKRLVEKMGGQININSQPGIGSEFIFTIGK